MSAISEFYALVPKDIEELRIAGGSIAALGAHAVERKMQEEGVELVEQAARSGLYALVEKIAENVAGRAATKTIKITYIATSAAKDRIIALLNGEHEDVLQELRCSGAKLSKTVISIVNKSPEDLVVYHARNLWDREVVDLTSQLIGEVSPGFVSAIYQLAAKIMPYSYSPLVILRYAVRSIVSFFWGAKAAGALQIRSSEGPNAIRMDQFCVDATGWTVITEEGEIIEDRSEQKE